MENPCPVEIGVCLLFLRCSEPLHHFFPLALLPSDSRRQTIPSLKFCQQTHSECQFGSTSAVHHTCIGSINATKSFGLCCHQKDVVVQPTVTYKIVQKNFAARSWEAALVFPTGLCLLVSKFWARNSNPIPSSCCKNSSYHRSNNSSPPAAQFRFQLPRYNNREYKQR